MRRRWNDGSGRGERSIGGKERRSWWVRLGIVTVIGALALGVGNPALASGQRAFADVSIFASAPAPGHPFGIAVDDSRVYVSTSAGDFFAGHQNSDDERVFAYDEDGNLVRTTVIDTAQDSDMGLFGLALDGNSGRNHKLYVADMNGRILRLDTGAHPAAPQVFSQVPISSGLAGDWMKSMWNDLVFDKAGNLYVPDDKPRIWRVGPDGTASIWFTDPRLTGFFGFAGGPLGGRIDPTGQWLYFSITVSLDHPLASLIYRVRLVDHPTAADLELVHEFAFDPSAAAPPQATGLAFAKSGNLYVSLIGPNQIAVLDPAGDEIQRISSPLFHSPWGLAFSGKSLLVTNGDLEPTDNPDAWKIFKVYVGETGLPLNRPKT
jgi:sugar lactone lactonase YvrE